MAKGKRKKGGGVAVTDVTKAVGDALATAGVEPVAPTEITEAQFEASLASEVIDPETTTDVETGCTVAEMQVDPAEYVPIDAAVEPEKAEEPVVVETTAEPVVEPEPEKAPLPFRALHLKYSAADAEGTPFHVPAKEFATLNGAMNYTTDQGGPNAVTASDGRRWLWLPDGSMEWLEVAPQMFAMAERMAAETWAAERKLLVTAYGTNGNGKPERKKREKSADGTAAAATNGNGRTRSTVTPWKPGDPMNVEAPFGLTKCAFLRAMGGVGVSVPGAVKFCAEQGIEINASTVSIQVGSVKDGKSSRGEVPVLPEEAVAMLQPYIGVASEKKRSAAPNTVNF